MVIMKNIPRELKFTEKPAGTKTDVALLLDTKGPEIRLGTFNGGKQF